MAFRAVKEIKETEDNALKIINDGSKEGKDIIKKATIEAERNFNNIINKAKEESKDIIKNAEEDGKRQAEQIIANGKKEAESIYSISDEKMIKAVNLVVERIVNIKWQ